MLEPYRDILALRGFNLMVETYCTPVQRDTIKAVQRHGSISGAAYEFGWYNAVIHWHFIRGLDQVKKVSRSRIYAPHVKNEIPEIAKKAKKIRPLYIAKQTKKPEIDYAGIANRLNHILAIAHGRIAEVPSQNF